MKLEIFCFTNKLNNLSYRLSELKITFSEYFVEFLAQQISPALSIIGHCF